MTEQPIAAVLYFDIAGPALARKELAEAMKWRGARVMKGEGGAIVAIFMNGDAAPSACVQAAIDGVFTADPRLVRTVPNAGYSIDPGAVGAKAS